MARTARIIDPSGGYYHVINRGNNRAAIFHDAFDFKAFLRIVEETRNEVAFRMPYYVLMSNHYHLLLMMPPDRGRDLKDVMKTVNQAYSLYYRRKYRFIGRIWQGRFKSFIITSDTYFHACGRYIEANPVRAGIVTDPSEYPWSSATSGERGLSPD